MPPKKKDSKKATAKEDEDKKKAATVTEVDKVFFDLQLADCNRKLARLRTAVDEYEQRNEELQKAYDKLDEDRADIIAYLKKTLNQKNEENSELKEKVKGLEEIRDIETKEFHETVAELERNFTFMKDQLTSENKLMAGKLNTLEEFRAIRDDLMRKFENQEKQFKEQEMLYKRKIYDAEKKFVVGKDQLKKEMEARLLQLAQDFQDATELRIASSTHRVIRENIAINNELDTILQTQAKMADQNEKFKEKERAARVAKELAEEERDTAINKSVVQLKVIDKLTKAFQAMKKEMAKAERKNYDIDKLQSQMTKINKDNENLTLQVRILEQNLHAKMCAQNQSLVEVEKVMKENARLKGILKKAAVAIRAALKLDDWVTTDPCIEILERQVLLSRLFEIITQYSDLQRAESIDTLVSLGRVYQEGDLGFIPKKPKKKITASSSSDEIKVSKSKEEVIVEKKSITSTASTLASGTLLTIPSADIIPARSQEEIATKDSWLSFMTSSKSSKSTASEATAKESDESSSISSGSFNVKKMLAYSRAEMTKSLVKELKSQQVISKTVPRSKKSMIDRKVSISEKKKSIEKSESKTSSHEERSVISKEESLEPRVSFSATHTDSLPVDTVTEFQSSDADISGVKTPENTYDASRKGSSEKDVDYVPEDSEEKMTKVDFKDPIKDKTEEEKDDSTAEKD